MALGRYLDLHRPALFQAPDTPSGKALWLSKGGAKMNPGVLAYRITKRTKDTFGAAINPHRFRHLAATTIATFDPNNATGVAAILGHESMLTSESYYNKARAVDAVARYNATVSKLRKQKRSGG